MDLSVVISNLLAAVHGGTGHKRKMCWTMLIAVYAQGSILDFIKSIRKGTKLQMYAEAVFASNDSNQIDRFAN